MKGIEQNSFPMVYQILGFIDYFGDFLMFEKNHRVLKVFHHLLLLVYSDDDIIFIVL